MYDPLFHEVCKAYIHYLHTYIHTDRQTDRHTYIHTYTRTYIHACIHIEMNMDINIIQILILGQPVMAHTVELE